MSKTVRMSQGAKFRAAINNNDPLQIVGTINAYSAMMAEKLVISLFTFLAAGS